MCSHYQAIKHRERYFRKYGVYPPPHDYVEDMWPKYMGPFIRRPPESDSGDEAVPRFESVLGRWGLVPWATKDPAKQLKLSTFNARWESAPKSFAFGGAWRRGQRCIVPAEAFYEPDWRTGKHVPTRIARADGEPMGIAGLWDNWNGPQGVVLSFTMLTINADDHPFMCRFHRPDDEKRMVVLLAQSDFETWLEASAQEAARLVRQCAPADLVAAPQPPPTPAPTPAPASDQ